MGRSRKSAIMPRPNSPSNLGKQSMGGSDSHTLACVGLTYTEVAGSRDSRSTSNGLRRGAASVHGPSGGLLETDQGQSPKSAAQWPVKAVTLLLSPLLLLVYRRNFGRSPAN